jgi:hypothetical protein
MKTRDILVAFVLAAGSLAGCNRGGTASAPAAGPATEQEAGIKRRSSLDLPALAEYLPPVDDGKLEIAGPEGWILLPGTSKYLASWAPDKEHAYPRISVAADDSPLPVLGDLTEENAAQFVQILDEPYKKKRASLPEPAKPIALGETLFIRQVRLVSVAKKKLALQWLGTVRGGRLYTVELFCEVDPKADDYATALTAARDFGYAVAAGLRTASTAGPVSSGTPASAAPATQPAGTEKKGEDATGEKKEEKEKE